MKIKNSIIEDFFSQTNVLLESSNTSMASQSDDGPVFLHKTRGSYNKKSNEFAEIIGYKILNHAINNNMPFDTNVPNNAQSDYPSGPLPVAAFFDDPNNAEWHRHIDRVAQQVGFKFLKYLNKTVE